MFQLAGSLRLPLAGVSPRTCDHDEDQQFQGKVWGITRDIEGTHVPWNLNLTVAYHFCDGNHSIFVYKLATTTENEEKSPLPIFNFPRINEEESFQINKKRGEILPNGSLFRATSQCYEGCLGSFEFDTSATSGRSEGSCLRDWHTRHCAGASVKMMGSRKGQLLIAWGSLLVIRKRSCFFGDTPPMAGPVLYYSGIDTQTQNCKPYGKTVNGGGNIRSLKRHFVSSTFCPYGVLKKAQGHSYWQELIVRLVVSQHLLVPPKCIFLPKEQIISP